MTGTIGEYYVCAKLCEYGYLALLTPKNNPLFDVIATTLDGEKSIVVQVKTRSAKNNQGWKFGKNMTDQINKGDLFVVLVNLKSDNPPDFYIYSYSELARLVQKNFQNYISQEKKDGSARKDPGFRWLDDNMLNDAKDQSKKIIGSP